MKTTWLIGCAIMGSLRCMAQEPIDPAVVNKIVQAEMTSSQIPQIAQGLLDQGGRLTASTGYKRAADWIMGEFNKWHLSNIAYEEWGTFGPQWETQEFSLEAIAPFRFPIHGFPVPWSPGGNNLQGEVTIISPQQSMDSTWLREHAADLKGKFILIKGQPRLEKKNFKPLAKRYDKAELDTMQDKYMISQEDMPHIREYLQALPLCRKLMKQAGALGVISALAGSDNGAVTNQTNYGYKKANPMVLPEANIATEDGERIARLHKAGKKPVLKLLLKVKTSANDVPGHNVIGEIKGSDPKLSSELVIIGGHLDSWIAATGATDNGAGCIVMMEAMRLLDSLKLVPRRTIRIALWDGEEQGLYGSFNYVQNHYRDKKTLQLKPEQEKVSVYFNLDNGSGKIRGIYAQNNTAVKPIFEKWLAPFDTLGATHVTMSNTGSTDHLSFDWAGIPGFQFIQDPIDYETKTHHTSMDDYDHLQIEDLKQAAAIVACFAYQASVRTEKLPRKPVENDAFIFDDF